MDKPVNELTVSEFGNILYQGIVACKKKRSLTDDEEKAVKTARSLLESIAAQIKKEGKDSVAGYELYGSIYFPYFVYRTKIQSFPGEAGAVDEEIKCLFKKVNIDLRKGTELKTIAYSVRVGSEQCLRNLEEDDAKPDWESIGQIQIKDFVDRLGIQLNDDQNYLELYLNCFQKYTAKTTAEIKDIPEKEWVEIDLMENFERDFPELNKTPDKKQKEKGMTGKMLLDQIMERFEAYNLTEGSKRELRNFFTFKINYSKRTEKTTVRYNLLVQCDDQDMMKDFLEMVNSGLLDIDDRQNNAFIQSEKDWHSYRSQNPNQTFWGIYDCKAPYSVKGNMYASSGEREKADEDKIKKDLFWEEVMSDAQNADEYTVIAIGPRAFIEYMHQDENRFFRFFAHHIYLEPVPVKQIIDETKRELKVQGFKLKKSFKTGIEKYIQTVYPKAELHDQPFVQDLVNRVLANYYVYSSRQHLTKKCVPYYRKARSYDDISGELNSLVGLDNVKKEFEKLYRMGQDKKQVNRQTLHFVFEGNPGTGKTTVAKMTAELLYAMGLIEKNKIVTVSRKEIISVYVGHTAQNMREKIQEAQGGVLFIDEAYFLIPKPGDRESFAKEALDVLVDETGNPKSKFSVIFAGYKEEMETLLESNDGLRSRIGYRFEFEDYTDEELLQIFTELAEKEDMTLDEDAHDVMLERIAYAKTQPGFGNARTMENLYQQLKGIWLEKGRKERVITEEDIRDTMPAPITTSLDEMIGLDEVKKQLDRFESRAKYLKFLKDHDMDTPPQNMHMLFMGNPGTGKTTVAQKIADCLYHIGILKTNKLTIAERKNLAIPGAAGPMTEEVVEKAKNGVLFIDEAYSLARPGNPSDPGEEVIEVLLTAMEKYKDCLVIIFAGYRQQMEQFLDMNPGIQSRIGFKFDFPNYDTDQLTKMFSDKMYKYGFDLDESVLPKVSKDIDFYRKQRYFGNGRFVDQMIDQTISNRSCRPYSGDDYKKITGEDVPDIKELANGNYVITDEDLSEEMKERTAVHEAGHALVAELEGEEGMITGASIKTEVNSLGRVTMKRDLMNQTEEELRGELATLFAGRDAERVVLGQQATGCETDISMAKYLAHMMVEDNAMGEFGVTTEQDLLMEADQEATELLDTHKKQLKEIAEFLLEKEEVSGKDLTGFCKQILT